MLDQRVFDSRGGKGVWLALSVGLAVALGGPAGAVEIGGIEPAMATVEVARADSVEAGETRIARAGSDESANESGRLEPRYVAREVEKKSWYNGSYIFGITRSLADSTIAPAGKAPLFVLTIPLDFAFLPFAIIGGLFG